MKGIYWLGLLGIASFQAFSINPCFAQSSKIEPDNSLGAESSQVNENVQFQGLLIEEIRGGAQRGINLFHSLREFNVNKGRGAYFFSPNAEIQNILARVTGNNRSEILGTLGTFGNSQPNLFLINPNGIVFGESASLDVQGSFVGTTANGVQFGEQGVFSATNPEIPPLLTVNPNALLFNQINQNAGIENNSVAPAGTSPSGINVLGLRVPDAHSLLLVGGDVIFEGGQSSALGGQLELGGLNEPGSITLQVSNETLKLGFPQNISLANVTLKDDARVSIRGAGGGNLVVNANTFTATNGGRLVAGTEKPLQGGDISVNANDFRITGVGSSGFGSGLYNQTVNDTIGSSGNIFVNSKTLNASAGARIENSINPGAEGDAGDIKINTKEISLTDGVLIWSVNVGNGNAGNVKIGTEKLIITDGGQVATKTFGKGKTGNLDVRASESIELIGSTQRGFAQSGLYVQVGQTGEGDARDLNIETNRLTVVDGAQVNATTFGKGNGGNLKVRASKIELLGTTTDGNFPSALQVRVEPGAQGNGGSLTIEAEKLSVKDGARVAADTTSSGNAGNLSVQAKDLVEVSGVSVVGISSRLTTAVNQGAVGNGGNLNVETNQLIVRDGGQVFSSTFGKGNAGDLTINANSIEITGASVSGLSGLFAGAIQDSGDGGDLRVQTDKLTIRDGATVSVSNFQSRNLTPPGSGSPGNLEINANSIVLDNKGSITAATSLGSKKEKGNIFIDLRDVLQVNNSTISTTSEQSSGGAINITAKDIRLFGDSDIRTNVFSGTGGGGNITLTANTIVALDDSDILSFARDGKGGDIRFNTEGFFTSSQFLPGFPVTNPDELDENGRVDVNASGAISGSITGIPDTNFIQNSLTDLPNNQIDPNTLIANSCIARTNNQNNTFFILGKGGIPIRPNDTPLPNHSTGSIRSLPTEFEKLLSANNRRPWKIGDPIVEPTGVYKLPNGKLILSRECG